MKTLLQTVLLLPCVLFHSSGAEVCPLPPDYPGFRMVRSYKDSAWYKCAEGYSPYEGSPVIRCSRGLWEQLTLQCRKKSCGNAGELHNGHFSYEGEAVLGDKAYAICYEGYKVKGPKVIVCGPKGWPAELPSCEEGVATCSAPEVANSEVTDFAHEYNISDTVTVRCSKGFQMKGRRTLTCGSDGHWQPPLPQCVPTPTPERERPVACSAPKVANSRTKDFSREYSVNNSVTVRCSEGFQLKGPGQLTCGPDGQWQPPPPQCVPAKTDRCAVPENIQGTNAVLAPKFFTQKSFASGTRVYYMCDVGHVISKGSKYRVCSKGRWSPLELHCRRRRCGSADELLNGHYDYTGAEFGDTATAVCDEGYQLFGQAVRHCLSRGWGGHPPVCEALTCDDPPAVTNAEVSELTDGPYEYMRVLTYRCLKGSATGPTDIWCTKDGTWTTPGFQCKDATCPSPNIPNALWIRSPSGRYRYRHSIQVHCNRPYILNGPKTITCNQNGQWSPTLPSCRPGWELRRRG